MTKKFFTLFFALVASVGTMFAWDYERVQIGDLYYNLDATNQTAEVTYKSYTNYEYNKGWGITTANIPASVEYYGVEYSVTSIGNEAFFYCYGLTSVTIPNSVTSIGEWAFSWCTGLTSVTIPNSVTSIGDDAFSHCMGLTSVTIGNSVTSIGKGAFYKCSSLTSVTIPNSVTSIGEYAFDDCFGLTSVHISDIAAWCAISFGDYSANPLSYAHNLYLNGELVTDLVIPNSVTSIGNYAFSDCTGLTSVMIPNSVTSIGDLAFSYCTGLTSINVETNNPNYCSVEGVLFNKDKTRLIQYPGGKQGAYTIPNSVTSIGDEAFAGCDGLTSVTIGNGVTSIGELAFSDCTGLTSVTIGNSVTSIGWSAFSDCSSLTSVTIPNSVTSIGELAFAYCSGLTSVTIEAETPPTLGSYAFDDTNNCPIYVPCNAINAYKSAPRWNLYADRIRGNCESSYTVRFLNWDGSVLQSTQVEKGEIPQYTGSTPARPDDEEYTYTFSGWTPAIVAATEDATYTATFTATPKGQGIDDVQSDPTQCTKVIRDGQLFILRGGKVYTISGQETIVP